ncbi:MULTISPECIES: radical SAM protein [Rhodomicrobium]|uniref:radical SAM protein n=1 Tax=Rhodomicrobium TaxID=1068 RepID=UPI001FD8FBAC|nr:MULTISPECIES: radical SAM protein [Rhodomicrobium]
MAVQSPEPLAVPLDPRRYFERIGDQRTPVAAQDPVCLYLETTNRCNLLCTTCPRTYEELEPPSDMSWELFTSIIDQFPRIERVVLHGVGEPMMVAELPAMVRYIKARDAYALFNTNGTLMREKKSRELIEAGLDEMRISLDAADAETFALVRGRDLFDRIVRNVKAFVALKKEMGAESPRLSLWLTGLKETLVQLPDFIRLAHEIGVPEVHLQRLVYFDANPVGLARPESSLFERRDAEEGDYLLEAERVAAELGVFFDASGAAEPEASLTRMSGETPWSLCRRPWSLMYFTAHGRALPCCIAPFSMHGYQNFTLGNAKTTPLAEIWNGPAYQDFRAQLLSDAPPKACAGCGCRWSL